MDSNQFVSNHPQNTGGCTPLNWLGDVLHDNYQVQSSASYVPRKQNGPWTLTLTKLRSSSEQPVIMLITAFCSIVSYTPVRIKCDNATTSLLESSQYSTE